MSNLCNIIDGEKQSDIKRIYLDVKYLRGKSDGEYVMSGKYVPTNSTMILVDGENSGEIFTTTIDGYQGSTFKLLDISNEMFQPFVLYIIKSYQKQFREHKVGSAIPHLNKKLFREIVVGVPPYDEQKRIVEEIEKCLSFIDEVKSNKHNLQDIVKQAKSKVLDLAIHGKLVEQNPNDEPAIELLKRMNPNYTPCDNSHYENLPKGWMVCQLEDIIEYEQPTQYIVASTNYSDEYEIPVLTAGKSFILGYTNETGGIYDKLPAIIFDDFTTDSRLIDFPFKVKSSAMKILQVNKAININYVAYFMSVTRLVGDTHKRYWISEYSKLQIPIPPINEQNRIVQTIQDIEQNLQTITAEL